MKTVLVWTVGLVVVAVTLITPGGSAPAPDGKYYTDKYDQMDIEPIMNNARTRTAFLKCLIKGESCTPEGETLKNNIPDALENKCAKCTDAQKKLLRKSSRHLKENNPDEWKQLTDHFDPEGKYSDIFEMFLSSED